MLIIDKTKPTARLILTVTETTVFPANGYHMVIHSVGSNNSYRIELGDNISPNISRYDEFLLDTQLFKDIDEGRYQYRVDTLAGNTAEVGLINIIGVKQQPLSIDDEATGYISI